MPEIAFFSNQFATAGGHGISRYARGLVQGIRGLENGHNLTPVASWSSRSPADISQLKAESGLRLLPTGRILTASLWMTLGWPKIENLLGSHYDVIHVNSLGYPVPTRRPLAVTVHDIGPLSHPQFFREKSNRIMGLSLRQAVDQAQALLCVSQTSADSLIDYCQETFGVDLQDRVFTVHEGITVSFFDPPDPASLKTLARPEIFNAPFILAVASISPRKNLDRVIEAIGRLSDRIPHNLIMVGGFGWDFEPVKRKVAELGLGKRVFFAGYVSDVQLRTLYHGAAAYIYPSLFEGFGLTLLEAMACGCPVITSDTSAMPEIAGDAAIFIDPESVDSIAGAIETVCLNQNGIADQLVDKGHRRASEFSWERCARATCDVYDHVLAA
jgi:glycosyltransferase involved in cell wall biosynthesis